MKKLFISILLLFFSNALLSQTYDANFNSFNFGTNFSNKIGNGQSNGNKVLYTNVITIGGQSIDVIVTTVSVSNVSSFQNYDGGGTAAEIPFFNPRLSFGSGGGSFKVNFQFILGGSYNNTTNTGTNIQIKNFYINSYDLDGNGSAGTNQFNEFQFFSSYELGGPFLTSTNTSNTPPSGNTVINVIPIPSENTTKFRSTHYLNSGTTITDQTRVRLKYENFISNVTINMGSEGSGLAFFFLDFSVGPSFGTAVSTLDSDSDGIIDANDTCPNTALGVTVGTNGCPLPPATPIASVTVQPTCAIPTGTIVFTSPTGVEYSINGTTYQSSATFTGVAPGTYTLRVRSTADNTLVTTGATVTVNAVASAPSTPSASVTVQPTCAVTTGTIVFTTQSGVEYSINGTTYQSSATFTGVAPGTYTLRVRSTTNTSCITTGATVTINAVPSAPSSPTASVTVQPTCAVTTGTIVFTTQSGVDYSINGTTYQSSATFTGVAPGTYTLRVRSTTDNTCITSGSSSVTVNAVPSAPSSPSASVTVQPTCAVPTGTIVFTTQSGVEYSINGTTYQSSATFTGVAPGTYTLRVRSTTNTSCITTGATVTINAVASAPSTPSASVTVQPTCAVPTGTIVFTTQSGVEYSIDGTTYQSSATFTGVAAGTYTISVRSTADNTCSTTGATLTINAVASAPSSPTASVTVQPTCAVTTGTIVFTTQSGVEYSIDGTTYQSSATFTGVAAGTYTISVRSTADNTCSTTGATVTVNAVASAPSTPSASVTVQPTCAVPTGTIVFTTQSGVEYSIDGTTYQSSATFTGVAAGTYTISVRSTADNTCSTTGATLTINAVVSAPSSPTASVTVQPTCAVPTGTIVFTTQSGVEYSIDDTTYQSSATFTGVAAGTYTISVRSTADNTCSTTGATVTINAVASAPSTPSASVTVQPTCAVPTGTIVFTTQSGVEYSIDGTTYQSSATFTGVAAGTYTISVRSTADNTCSTTGATLTINAVASAPSSPTASVTVQPTCAVTTGTIVFTTQSGVEYSIDGTTYQSSATFTGVAAGTYTISVRSTADNTCSTTGATVTVNAVASAPSTPSASVTVQPTCAVPTGTIVFTTQSGVEYSIDGTTYQSSATFTGVAAGTYTISVRSTADNTCSTTGATLTINAVVSAPSSPTASVTVQPTCAVPTGTIVFTTQSGVDYSIDGATYQSSATFTGVAAGTYTISVRSTADNTCSTTGATVTINAVPSAPSSPSASVTVQPTCAVTTGTIVFTTQSGVEYSIDGTTYQSSATFTGVAAGTYNISVRSTADNTCSTTGATVTINAVASAPSTPSASVTVQPTCAVPTGTIVFTTQSGVDYSIDGATYQSSATFTGVAAGTYTISVRSTADNTCSTTGATVTINAVPSAPSSPSASVTVQPTCAVTTGTIVFTTQSGVEYSIDGTTYQSSATFTGVAAGTYNISVRSTADNTCSTTGATLTINAVVSAPSSPTASVTVQPTCAVPTGTIVFTTQSGVEYSIDDTTYQSSATFTGVAAGTYTISVRSTADNTCSTTGATVTINAVVSAPSSPTASVTVQPTCAVPTGTIVFTTQSGVEYSIDGTTYQSSATFTGVAAGTYTISVRSTADNTCSTTGATVTINAVASAPSTPSASVTVQPTCAVPTGTIVFTTQSGVEYSIDGTTYQSSATFTGVAAGTYTISVRSTADNTCSTTGATVTINAVASAPSSPTASVTVQPTCAVPTGTIVFTTQSGVEYSIDGTTYQSSATFTGVAAGTYTISVRSTADNTCSTTGATVTIDAVKSAPSTPSASVTVQPTCAVPTGTIVFTTQSGVEYSIDGTTYQSSATFTGVAAGTYTISVRSTADNTCSTTGATLTINAVPSAPSSPSASVTVQPTCAVPTGTIVFTTQSGVEYSIDGTTYQSSATFTGVAAGTYTISVRSTADNTCSTTGATVTIDAVKSAPSTPSASVTVQPTCAVPTGTIVFTTQSGVEYSIDGTTYQSSATFTGVAAGTYTISVRSTADNTCSTTGATVTINAVPSAPSSPTASVTVQPTCAVPTGTIVFTTQSGVEYSIDGTTYQSSATFTGVAAGTYTISVRSTADNTCSTTGATVTINAVPSAPSSPTASVTVQPTCAVPTGTIVFTTQSGVEYSIDGTTYQSSATFTGVAAGTYTISVRSTADNTCSTTGATVTINAVPSAPSSPTASVTVQPTCAVPTGTIVFTTQSGVEYSIDGATYQSSATFTGVAAGTYTISVRSTADNTCSTTGATVTINAVASAPSTPSASVTVQPTCAVPTGTIVFTTQSGVEYSIDGTTYQSSATFTGVAAGTYTISVRSTADNTCSTTGATVTINAVASAPSTPSASVTVQPTCAVPTGTIVFTTQSGVEYSIDGTTYQSSATFTGVAAGTYTISVRSTADNTCSTTGATVTINAVPSAPSSPTASVTVQPTCAVTTGTIVFTTQSGVEYSIDGTTYQSSATFTGVAAGTYTISVRSTADNTCSTTGATLTINAVASAPITPSASVTVQPTCAVPTGTIVFTTQSGVEYSIDGTTYQSSATFTGVAAGTYTISVRSTADNTCSTTGATLTINAVASAPITPSASVTVQPTCAVPTGTIVFTTQSGVEYSIDGTTYQSSATFTGVAAGTYTISVRSTADNTCSTTGANSVTVFNSICAVDDSYSSINGYTGSTTASVLVNDTLNGVVVNPSQIILTPVTVPSGFTLNADGTITIASGISAGTYTVTYSICEVLNPTNCDTADVFITVVAAPIVAVDDSYSSINGYTGSTTASVLVNDTLNGVVVNPSQIILTPVTVPSGFTLNADGTITIASGISAGTYTVTYSICEVLNPTNCDTADVFITVVAAPIVAVDDSYSSINGYTGSTTASVLVNDTLNGVVVNPSQIILTPVTVPSGFTLNADGTITIASGISAGTYTVTYSICEVLNPTNCDTADVFITVVAAPIVAVDDSYSSINGYTGSTTASVLANDTLNGVVVNPSQIILTPVTVPSGFTLNTDGTITIASGISAGTYTVTYSICEVLNPTNCDTADVVITVVAAPIVAVDDSYSSINGYTGSTTASVLVNDTLNGVL
ncbi:MAG: hypothetical protein RSE15_10375 [Flavobacterium sp.]|uniref:hypothetical protein n=1 Tax=Flavobacterium sp. TaxID=239 RepID=UPI002B47456D|nr:hypothetical protein [Flavobacterium sp.]WRH72756.1 MAG: hypothetical protein RSE15_10375 [Flavobacterium sp.]